MDKKTWTAILLLAAVLFAFAYAFGVEDALKLFGAVQEAGGA